MASLLYSLHGNKIAEVGDNFVRLFDGGWQSNTTKSRLNAILSEHGLPGERVFQRKFEWFVSQEGERFLSSLVCVSTESEELTNDNSGNV